MSEAKKITPPGPPVGNQTRDPLNLQSGAKWLRHSLTPWYEFAFRHEKDPKRLSFSVASPSLISMLISYYG